MKLIQACSVCAFALAVAASPSLAQKSDKAQDTANEPEHSQSGSGTSLRDSQRAQGQGSHQLNESHTYKGAETGRSSESGGASSHRANEREQQSLASPSNHENSAERNRGESKGQNQAQLQNEPGNAAANGETSKGREGEQRGAENRVQEDRAQDHGEHNRVSIDVRPQQKTQVREFITKDRDIRRYSRGELHFSENVGTYVPDRIVYYDPPIQLIDLIPAIRPYKIIVTDDAILVIDPANREIVDVIELGTISASGQ